MMKNRSLLDNSSEESYRSKSSHESDVKESREKKIRPKRVPLLNIRKPKRYLTFIVQKKSKYLLQITVVKSIKF